REPWGKARSMAVTEFLDTALAIGRRLALRALWEGTACTWEVLEPQPDPENLVRTTRAGGQLYQGAAGIAWFLGELYRATGEAEVGRAARGGLEHALARGDDLSDLFGFHSGRVGIAWVAVRLAGIFERPDYAERARRLLAPLAGRERQDSGLDVIAGAGGAIPACLDLAEKAGWDELRAVARELGEHLIGQAQRRPDGWSWATGGEGAVRNLAGFAHGASGVGLALLELDHAAGDSRFRFAAEMAFLYERRLFNEERSNWPDLRHDELGEALFYGRVDELRRVVRDGKPPAYEERYLTAWCHGSPGIGLARLRAFELTGQPVYRQEAEAALRSTLRAIEDELSQGGNYSLCHGIGGNCELPLLAAELLGDPELRQVAERAAREGIATYEARGRPWPCGTRGGVPDPSLLVGEAGIGAFYLRLADPETPSVLLLRPRAGTTATEGAGRQESGFRDLARESAGDFFATTLRVWSRLAPPGAALPSWGPGGEPLVRAPAEEAHEVLVAQLEEQSGELRARLADAFEPERVRYELTLELVDHTEAALRRLVRPAWEEIDLRGATFTLTPGTRLVSTRHDWQSWLGTSGPEPPPESDVSFLCHQEGNDIRCRRVGPMAALVLEAASDPASLDEIVARVAEAAGIARPGEELAGKIRAQLRELYAADLVGVRCPE
ncbi:MAG TPA: lanthionine synthetase LanC family protein, partial [Thermoanaerobaculia bacterium]|nr:lanthionine synthetase LanC family protein [Thermoanaerobaculia bacterium]